MGMGSKKRGVMKPVVRYAVVHDHWKIIGQINLDTSLRRVREHWGHLLLDPMWRIVRFYITEVRAVPKARGGKKVGR